MSASAARIYNLYVGSQHEVARAPVAVNMFPAVFLLHGSMIYSPCMVPDSQDEVRKR
jgi:hypothetical protein